VNNFADFVLQLLVSASGGEVGMASPQEKLPPPLAGLWPGFFPMYRSLCAPKTLFSPLLARLWRRYCCWYWHLRSR